MPKRRKPEKRPFSLPEEYNFLPPILNAFLADEASLTAEGFLKLPKERQQHYFEIKQKLIELPVESALKLSKLYKQYPIKRYAETQKIHLFFSQLSRWQEAPVLDLLPAELVYLVDPTVRFDLWSADDVEYFLNEGATGEDKLFLRQIGHQLFEQEHEKKLAQFFTKYPAHFFHESMLLKNLLVVIQDSTRT